VSLRHHREVEELRMHLAWRWFTGLDQEIPHHSTFYGAAYSTGDSQYAFVAHDWR